jgi:hypothetical protein
MALVLVAIVGILTIILAILIPLVFQLTIVQIVFLCWILTALYAIFIVLVVDPRLNPRQIQLMKTEVIRNVPCEVEKEVIRNVFVDRPIIVEKEVIKQVPYEVEKTVYRTIEAPHISLNIPRYEFIGSTQTKTYHRRTCKFSKMLKNKFKEHSNSASFFKKKHYKACKTCINIKKK